MSIGAPKLGGSMKYFLVQPGCEQRWLSCVMELAQITRLAATFVTWNSCGDNTSPPCGVPRLVAVWRRSFSLTTDPVYSSVLLRLEL